MDSRRQVRSFWTRYGFAWVTLGLFGFSLIGHWIFGWFAYADEQALHGQAADGGGYFVEMMRDTFENWQSEFLQLIWQVAGLALFLYLGSPQSKEGDDRLEAKLDALLLQLHPDGDRVVQDLDEAYAGRHTDEQYLRRQQSRLGQSPSLEGS